MKYKSCKTKWNSFRAKSAGIVIFFLLTSFPSFFLSIDAQQVINICNGDYVNLVSSHAGTIVEWKDQSGNVLTRVDGQGVRITDLTPKVKPTVNTTYTVKQIDALNLVPNGNFDPPPASPATLSGYDYIAIPRNYYHDYAKGFFTIQDNPQDLFDSAKYVPGPSGWGTNWYRSIGDHTSGHGNMFIANGSTVGTTVYTVLVNVTAGTTYYVGAWFANINVTFVNPYNMDIYIKGVKIGNISGSANDNWYQKYVFWKATATETVRLEFKNTQFGNDGNDFAIDDIVFSPVIEETVTVKVSNPSSSITNATICSGSSYLFNNTAYTTAGNYTYTTKNIGGCDSIATLVLSVNPLLSANISGETIACQDSVSPRIVFKGMGGIPPYTFNYQINGGADQYVTTVSGDTVSLRVSTATEGVFVYKLMGVVDSNAAGCTYAQNDSIVCRINSCRTTIDIPNAFTPNNDGINDTFGPKTLGVVEFKMLINDRNGRLVYTIDSVNGRWDGRMSSGEDAPVGVYFYQYNAKSTDAKTYSNHGSVSLFRELIDASSIEITPNPVGENAIIDVSKLAGIKNLSIYSTSGRQLKSWNTTENQFSLDASQLTKGLYLLKVSCNTQIIYVKFIKR